MNRPSLDKFQPQMVDGGVLVINSSLVDPALAEAARVRLVAVPANEIADSLGNTRMTEFQEQTGHLYNLEATPAEGTTYRFAKEDRKRFPGILQAGTPEKPYYTNSSQLPVGFTDDPFEALACQEELQRKYTGGTVLHLYMPRCAICGSSRWMWSRSTAP